MDNITRVNLEIQVAAQRMIQTFMLHNEQVKESIENGIKKAFKEFDFEEAVKDEVKKQLKASIVDYNVQREIRTEIKQKLSKIINDKFDKINEEILKNIIE
jgi:glutamate formiminotransferase